MLGLDLGTRRTGAAVSDADQRLALGVRTLVHTTDAWRDRRAVVALIDDYQAVGVVVGLPLSLDGSVGTAGATALSEVDGLRRLLAVPVVTADERLTTIIAGSALRSGGRSARQQRHVVDQTAAALILQSWLDRRASAESEGGSGG